MTSRAEPGAAAASGAVARRADRAGATRRSTEVLVPSSPLS
jgi:hypothetical protein